MKTLFRSIFSVVMVATLCVTSMVSCTMEEEYDFAFEMPGQIVTEFGKTLKIPFKARNITSITVSSSPLGWKLEDVDILNRTVTITAPSSFETEGEYIDENGELTLMGFTAAGTTISASSYLSLLNKTMDLSDEYSNCYILTQPDTRYTIDLTHKGESGERIAPASAKILWHSDVGLLKYSSYDSETGKFTFYVEHEDVTNDDNTTTRRIPDGNAVVAAYDDAGNVIWSWHIWLTGDDPNLNTVTTSAGVFMDRNLGAYHNSDGSDKSADIFRSYGLYYQWGRKDPFARPTDYKFSSNGDQLIYSAVGASILHKIVGADSEDAGVGTYEYSVANPMTFILGSADNDYDWIYSSHNDALWSATAKSVNDPCPRGWRVPDATVFEAFDIVESEDQAPSADVRSMYGWHLADKQTGAMLFLPGAGRRSFENGILTNVNNYGFEYNPMPWTGSYWTAGVDGALASSLFFDLNTTRAVNNRYEPRKPMYRANAMQVRCVRE